MPSLHRRHSSQRDTLRRVRRQGHPRVSARLYEDRLHRGWTRRRALTTPPNASELAADALARWITAGPQDLTEQWAELLYVATLLALDSRTSPSWRWGDGTYTEHTGVVELGNS